MASITSVPVTLPKDKPPSKENIRDIISTFLTEEWPSVDPETLKVSYNDKFNNAHCYVARPEQPTGIHKEPLKLFVKIHREHTVDIEAFKDLAPSKAEEALFCHQYSQTGLGARVYGVFKTQDGTLGRIDEYLDARTLEPEDVEDADIRADIARCLARFHLLERPMKKPDVRSYHDGTIRGMERFHRMEKLKVLAREEGIDLDGLVDYDFGSRMRKAVDKMESIGGKTGWCIHDVQYMNVLVKNQPREGESKVVLIDFETTMRNCRGQDIGGHFFQKMFKWFDEESKVVGCRSYSEEERRHFCEEYAEEWNRVTGDSDSGERVFLESEYGFLLAICFDLHYMLYFMATEGDKDPLNLLALRKLFDEFVAQYERLGLGYP